MNNRELSDGRTADQQTVGHYDNSNKTDYMRKHDSVDLSYSITDKNVNNQRLTIYKEEELTNNLISLAKKYQQPRNVQNDPYDQLIETKDILIEDLKKEIIRLDRELVDRTIVYNEKIEQQRFEHKKELQKLRREYVKKIKESMMKKNNQ
jgi:hypothetical protein